MKRFFMFFAACVMLICATGCGGDTNGNISLALSSVNTGGGRYQVLANAVFRPGGGQSPLGADITLEATVHNGDFTESWNDEIVLHADPAGGVGYTFFIQQGDEPIYVDVSASIGGLEDFKTVTIPAASP